MTRKNISKLFYCDFDYLESIIPDTVPRVFADKNNDYPFLFIENFLDDSVCDDIISDFQLHGPVGHSVMVSDFTAEIAPEERISFDHKMAKSHYSIYLESFQHNKTKIEEYFDVEINYNTGFLPYGYPPGGHLTLHADNCNLLYEKSSDLIGVSYLRPERTISSLMFLNDCVSEIKGLNQYTGGELVFPFLTDESGNPMIIKPRKGLFIAFPSHPYFSHKVQQIIEGYRYSVVDWYHCKIKSTKNTTDLIPEKVITEPFPDDIKLTKEQIVEILLNAIEQTPNSEYLKTVILEISDKNNNEILAQTIAEYLADSDIEEFSQTIFEFGKAFLKINSLDNCTKIFTVLIKHLADEEKQFEFLFNIASEYYDEALKKESVLYFEKALNYSKISLDDKVLILSLLIDFCIDDKSYQKAHEFINQLSDLAITYNLPEKQLFTVIKSAKINYLSSKNNSADPVKYIAKKIKDENFYISLLDYFITNLNNRLTILSLQMPNLLVKLNTRNSQLKNKNSNDIKPFVTFLQYTIEYLITNFQILYLEHLLQSGIDSLTEQNEEFLLFLKTKLYEEFYNYKEAITSVEELITYHSSSIEIRQVTLIYLKTYQAYLYGLSGDYNKAREIYRKNNIKNLDNRLNLIYQINIIYQKLIKNEIKLTEQFIRETIDQLGFS